jgi:uncharacterized coiled-coil DUF342 family protein
MRLWRIRRALEGWANYILASIARPFLRAAGIPQRIDELDAEVVALDRNIEPLRDPAAQIPRRLAEMHGKIARLEQRMIEAEKAKR